MMVKVRFNDQPIQVRVDGAALVSRQAALAQDAAEAAQSFASAAEAFAGPTFPDTAAGLAGTTDGQSFAVNEDGIVTIYLNDEGDAVAQRVIATTAALASTEGAEFLGFLADPTLSPVTLGHALKSIPLTPGMAGTAFGIPGNVEAISKFLAAQARPIDAPITREVPQPKLHLTSSIAAGKTFHGFPSAVRHEGKDYILYREGNGHIESTPITNTARLVCSVRDMNGVAPESRTIIYEPSGIDPRDPNVLRDDYGNAILVGGVFKVVIFEWAGSYAAGNATAKVFNLNPANLAAGLTSPVSLPAPIEAVKSDVRLLSDGATYAFVGYSTGGTCYLVTTTNWSTFDIEEIGPGNEAAFCETVEDATLNVIVRAEENFGNKATIFYKRATAGGPWRVHAVLPYTLNAPTLVKSQGIRATSTAGQNEGWLLFARDKTGRTALTQQTAPVSELVCLRSRQDYGRVIDFFSDRVVIAGNPNPANHVLPGDTHYCSVVAGEYSGQLQIYTYGEFGTGLDVIATTFRMGVWRIEAVVDADQGVRPIMPQRRNFVRNATFKQGAAGIDDTNANASIVTDSITGRNVLRISDKMTSQFPFVMADVLPGDTLFPKITTKLNFSDLAGTGRHVVLEVRNGNTDAVIQSDAVNLNPLDFFGEARTVLFRPVVAPTDKIKLVLKTATDAGLTDAESDVFHIELSDDYSRNTNEGPPVETVVRAAEMTFPTTGGGKTSSSTYSSGFWAQFGLPVKASGIPLAAADYTKLSVVLQNCTSNGGTVRVICTNVVVNSNGSISANFSVAPNDAGNLASSVTCRAIISVMA